MKLGGPFAYVCFWVFGILLPAGTILFERSSHACASVLFDPVPTTGHFLVLLAAPLLTAALVLRAPHVRGASPTWLGWALGFVLGVNVFYGVVFLPLTPLSIIMVLAGGIGILALAPVLAGVTAIVLWARMRRQQLVGVTAGFVLAWAGLSAFDAPVLWARLAQVGDADDVPYLRAHVPESVLERLASDTNLMSPLGAVGVFVPPRRLTPAVFYRVTGRLPPPRRAGLFDFEGLFGPGDEWMDDEAWRWRQQHQLCMSASELVGGFGPGAGHARIAWTMQFRNDGVIATEAMLRLALPEGAVVADATLWVRGKPRSPARPRCARRTSAS